MQRVDEALYVVAVRLDQPAEIAPLCRPGVRRGVGTAGELGERRRELGDVALDVLLRVLDAFESTFIPLRSSPNELREVAAATSYGRAHETDWQFGTALAAARSVLAEAP